MHLAEFNVARLRHPLDHPLSAEFKDNLDRVNGAGKRMPGFVWMMEDAGGSATSFRINDDPQMLVNLSVWESAEHLRKFVFGLVHAHFYKRGDLWFEAASEHKLVLWHVEPGVTPTLEEAVQRLSLLRAKGPSPEAFGWAEAIGPQAYEAVRCG